MSIKVLTSEYLISDTNGTGLARNWFPRIVSEAFLESTKDGEIERSPDPVTFIDGDTTWFNNSGVAQQVAVLVHRAPRSIVVSNPSTVIIIDSWSSQIGVSPTADYPSVEKDMFGGRIQIDRPSVAAADLLFGRFFIDHDDGQVWVPIGKVPAMQSFHFRYVCSVQTPGVWTKPSEFDPRYEAQARYARLQAWAWPA